MYLPCLKFILYIYELETVVLAERGILSVKAEGQGSCFLFTTIHLESPIAPKSPLRTFFQDQRRVQAQQVWLIIA